MSEDIRVYVSPDAPRWQLSGQDETIIRRLHAEVWQWLLVANTSKDVQDFGFILEALEDLIEIGRAPGCGECEIILRSEGEGGLSAQFSTSPSAIMFGLTEFVWMGEQGYDHGNILDEQGRPFHLEFTPSGSFDGAAFEVWLSYAERATPSTIADPAEATASWYS